jgi:hypothetical protein
VKPARRYAHGTDVPCSKTRGEIESLLVKHGAAQFLSGFDHQKHTGFVGFTLHGRQYRIPLLPRQDNHRDREQVSREQWRALLLLCKAKLEFVASGLATVENEFLAHLVLPNGNTVGAEIAPRIAEAYAGGQVTNLLPA